MQQADEIDIREHLSSGLTDFTHKDLLFFKQFFDRLCDKSFLDQQPLFRCLHAYFSYYKENITDENLHDFPLLGRLMFLCSGLLSETDSTTIQGQQLEAPPKKRDTHLFTSAKQQKAFLSEFTTILGKKIVVAVESDIALLKDIFQVVLNCTNTAQQNSMLGTLKAYFRKDKITFQAELSVCTSAQKELFRKLVPAYMASSDAQETKKTLLDDVSNSATSRLIAALANYNESHKGRSLEDTPDYPIVAGFLADLGRINPIALLEYLHIVLNTFLENPNDEFLVRKLGASTFPGRLLNATCDFVLSPIEHEEFQEIKKASKERDPDKIMSGDLDNRRKFLTILKNAANNAFLQTYAHLSADEYNQFLERDIQDVTTLIETVIKDGVDKSHHVRRAAIIDALLAYAELQKRAKAGIALESADFEQKVAACRYPADRTCFKNLCAVFPGVKARIVELEKTLPEEVLTPSQSRRKFSEADKNKTGIKAFVLSRLSRSSRSNSKGGDESAPGSAAASPVIGKKK